MLSEILGTVTTSTATITITTAFLYAAAAGVLGFLISITYMKSGKVSMNFARTLVLLPVMVCVIMTMVNGNLGTSVAIMGAFSLVRFRSLQGSSRDIAFIFWTMTIGVTCSMGYIAFAFCITALLAVIILFLSFIRYGEEKQQQKDLHITIPENLDYTHIFDEVFAEFAKTQKMLRVKTTNMGSLYELQYHVVLKDDEKEKEFLDAIRCRNGNLTVICGRCSFGGEEL